MKRRATKGTAVDNLCIIRANGPQPAKTGGRSRPAKKKVRSRKTGSRRKSTKKKLTKKKATSKKKTRKKTRSKTGTGRKKPSKKKPARKKPTQKKPVKKKKPAKKPVKKKKAPSRKKHPPRTQVKAARLKPAVTLQEPPPKKEFSKELYRLYEQALELLYQNSYKKARDQFVRLLEKFPTDIEITSRAKTFIRVCDRHLDREQKQPPLTSEDIFNQAVIHHNASRYEEALTTLSQAMKLTRKKKDHIHYAMAAAEICMGNTDQGLKHLKKAIEINEENRFFARNDPDFEPVTQDAAFQQLLHPE